MADRRPPEPPRSPKSPNSPDKKEGGFNWRVFALFAIAMGVLSAAWYYQGMRGKVNFDYDEFERQHYSGFIYKKGDHKGDDAVIKQYKLNQADQSARFTTEGYSAVGKVTGLVNVIDKRDLSADPTEDESFKVYLNQSTDHETFNSFSQDLVSKVDWVADPAAAFTQQVGAEQAKDIKTLSVSELRKLFYRKEVSQLQVLKSDKPSGQAIVLGKTLKYPEVAFDAYKKALAKDKKITITDKEFEAGLKYVPFHLTVNLARRTPAEKLFLNKSVGKYKNETGGFGSFLITLLPFLLFLVIIIFFFRHQMKSAGKGAMNFGKSKARLLNQDGKKVTFKDVAGIQEAKEELYEIVDFLKGPKKFEMLGGNIPKGVLMVGPPGTGKTLLARAIAGEADVPFFSISGSDFVEMFVGVGASRVRDMFEQGKKNSPCIVFIDEIDAVGRHRGHGHGGGNDEREQTLNALLVEMDGFDAHSGVIIIAATNRPDVLDPALLRPGRFDRQVTVSLPDYKGREQILAVHSKKIKLKEGTDLSTVSRGTPGFSGAELANLINEAALLAARRGLKEVTIAELEEARDKVRWGRERRSLAMSDKEKANTAYHEAGHAICNLVCENTDNLHKVTIIPRGPSLGMAMFLPTEDRVNYREAELIDQLCVAMGGRVAEEIVFGNVTNGAMGDIRQATSIARKMVCEWGMSKNLGMVDYGGDEHQQDMFTSSTKSYSENTAQKIDDEIKTLIDEGYQRALQILTDNRDALNLISEALLEFETLNGDQINDLLVKGVMDNPPSSPTPPEAPAPTEKEDPEPKTESTSDDDDEPLAPEAVGAPA